MWEAQSRQNLMRARSVYRSSRNKPWTSEKALALTEDKTWQSMIKARGHQNPPLRPRSRTTGFWGAIVGLKNLTTSAHLILSPRPMPRRKEWPRMNKKVQVAQKHRRGQSGPRPTQILVGKNGPPSTATSQSVSRKRTSTVGQLREHGVRTVQGKTVTFALNAHN